MLCLLLMSGAGNAFAHSQLLNSEPIADGVYTASPLSVTLAFSSNPEKNFNRIELLTAHGWQALDVTQKKSVLSAKLPPLSRGNYTLRWSILSRDGHPQHGSFSFRIR